MKEIFEDVVLRLFERMYGTQVNGQVAKAEDVMKKAIELARMIDKNNRPTELILKSDLDKLIKELEGKPGIDWFSVKQRVKSFTVY